MIIAYTNENGDTSRVPITAFCAIPENAVWIDLLKPSTDETEQVERALGIDLPTQEEMREIEVSSRLYQDKGGFFMTATILHKADTETPEIVPVTFILAGQRLITLRHAEPQPFAMFGDRIAKPDHLCRNGVEALSGLLDAVTDRLADILERVQNDVDLVSRDVFDPKKRKPSTGFEQVLKRLGRDHHLVTWARESLVSVSRMLSFLGRTGEGKPDRVLIKNVQTLTQDVAALSDHTTYLSGTITFLLETTLGLINIEQSGIIKIFSVIAVVFLPPTLVASIYGMNFDVMPELHWTFGYPMAMGIMLLSAILPYLFFKGRGWL